VYIYEKPIQEKNNDGKTIRAFIKGREKFEEEDEVKVSGARVID
jgi:hypothetical protein